MKSMIVVALALVAIAVAAPPSTNPDADSQVLRSEYNHGPDGSFAYSFETDKGIKQAQIGELKTVVDEEKKPQTVVVVRGEYSYINADGSPETVQYVADELGYRADGPSIPKEPVAVR